MTASEEWQPWLLYILKGTEEVSRWTCQKIAAIRYLMESAEPTFRGTSCTRITLDTDIIEV